MYALWLSNRASNDLSLGEMLEHFGYSLVSQAVYYAQNEYVGLFQACVQIGPRPLCFHNRINSTPKEFQLGDWLLIRRFQISCTLFYTRQN